MLFPPVYSLVAFSENTSVGKSMVKGTAHHRSQTGGMLASPGAVPFDNLTACCGWVFYFSIRIFLSY